MLLNEHLMGKTILDMDGRRTEVVNDVHLLESKGEWSSSTWTSPSTASCANGGWAGCAC